MRYRLPFLWAGCGSALAGLWAVGPVVPTPPLLRPQHLAEWWTGVGPVVASFAAVRVALLGLGAVWSAALVAGLVVRVLLLVGRRGPAALRGVSSWSGACGWSRLLRLAMGLSVSGGLIGACGTDGSRSAAPGHGNHAPPPPVLAAPVVAGGAQRPAVSPAAPPGTQRSLRTPTAPGARPGVVATTAPHGGGPRPAPSAASAGSAACAQWTIRPGDDFWSIAEAVVRTRSGSVPSRVVARYWATLVAANRERLPVPDDPNLLFPGDVIALPPISPAGG